MNKSFAVVIPCYDEGIRILRTVKAIRNIVKVPIFVIDDFSTDGCCMPLIKMRNVFVLRNECNKGKAASLLVGCEEAFNHGVDCVVLLDADGQHDPEFIPFFISALDNYDVILGVRSRDDNMPKVRRFGNAVITFVLRVLYGLKISDALSGYKAFWKESFERIRWRENGRYLVESDMLINIAKHDLTFKELDIPTIYVNKGGITKRDGLKIVFNIIKRRLLG